MSSEVYTMPASFLKDQSVPARWRVMGIINGFLINGLDCYGSNKWFMEKLGCSEQTISNAFQELEEIGEIVCTRTRTSRRVSRRINDPSQLGSRPKPVRVSDPSWFGTNASSNASNKIVLQAKLPSQEEEYEIQEDKGEKDTERGYSRKGDPAVVRVERKFLDKVKTELGQVVPPSAAGRMLVKRALSRMSEEDCMEKIEDWFTRSVADQRLMSIKACFSDNEINGWLAAYEK